MADGTDSVKVFGWGEEGVECEDKAHYHLSLHHMAHQLPLAIITHTSSFSSQDGALLSASPLGIQGEQLRASTCHRYFCGFVFRQMQQGESDRKL